jgi:hypothetical protein
LGYLARRTGLRIGTQTSTPRSHACRSPAGRRPATRGMRPTPPTRAGGSLTMPSRHGCHRGEGKLARGQGYNATRGAEVIARVRAVLTGPCCSSGTIGMPSAIRVGRSAGALRMVAPPGSPIRRSPKDTWAGDIALAFLEHHGLHIEVHDRTHLSVATTRLALRTCSSNRR